MHILVFICYVINIFSLFEYAQRKGNYMVFTRFHKFSNIKNNYFFLIENLGFTNPTPLKRISSSRFVRKGIQ
jgi:hypothetical protein